VKEKPAIRPRKVIRSNTSPFNSLPQHNSDDSFISSSATSYHRMRSESLPRSSDSSPYNDFTTSLPSNFDATSYQKPVPKPRTRALFNRAGAPDVNISNHSNSRSTPPKVCK